MSCMLDNDEDALREAMIKQWQEDCDILLSNGWVAPWDVNGGVLDDDEARALTLIADNGGIVWSDSNPHACRPTIAMLGMSKKGNTTYILRKMRDKGWLSFSNGLLTLSQRGMWALNLHEDNYDGEPYEEGIYVEEVKEMNEGLFAL